MDNPSKTQFIGSLKGIDHPFQWILIGMLGCNVITGTLMGF